MGDGLVETLEKGDFLLYTRSDTNAMINDVTIDIPGLPAEEGVLHIVSSILETRTTTTTTTTTLSKTQRCYLDFCNDVSHEKLLQKRYCGGTICRSADEAQQCELCWKQPVANKDGCPALYKDANKLQITPDDCLKLELTTAIPTTPVVTTTTQSPVPFSREYRCYSEWCVVALPADARFRCAGDCTSATFKEETFNFCKNAWENPNQTETGPNPEECINPPDVIAKCFLDYCNGDSCLAKTFCATDQCSTDAEADLCEEHWHDIGRYQVRVLDPQLCGDLITTTAASSTANIDDAIDQIEQIDWPLVGGLIGAGSAVLVTVVIVVVVVLILKKGKSQGQASRAKSEHLDVFADCVEDGGKVSRAKSEHLDVFADCVEVEDNVGVIKNKDPVGIQMTVFAAPPETPASAVHESKDDDLPDYDPDTPSYESSDSDANNPPGPLPSPIPALKKIRPLSAPAPVSSRNVLGSDSDSDTTVEESSLTDDDSLAPRRKKSGGKPRSYSMPAQSAKDDVDSKRHQALRDMVL